MYNITWQSDINDLAWQTFSFNILCKLQDLRILRSAQFYKNLASDEPPIVMFLGLTRGKPFQQFNKANYEPGKTNMYRKYIIWQSDVDERRRISVDLRQKRSDRKRWQRRSRSSRKQHSLRSSRKRKRDVRAERQQAQKTQSHWFLHTQVLMGCPSLFLDNRVTPC